MNLNQTLQEKYPHLEISVLRLSEAQKDNESKRIDSEYFKKEYLENEEIILSNFVTKDFLDFRVKNIKSLALNKKFNYLQISDINLANGFDYSTTEMDYKKIPDRATYILKNNDICVSSVRPNRNAIALVKNPKRLVGTNGFAILRLKNKSIIPEFLYIFCKTNFFITKMMRANTASLYPAVLDSDIYRCPIPILPMEFQKEIEKMVKDSYKALEESRELYKKAEEVLYIELGLNPKNPLQSLLNSACHFEPLGEESRCFFNTQLNISIQTLKESFLKTGRLDSEYYQTKYEDIENFIKSYSNGYDSFSNIINNKDTNFIPKSNENYKYIELANIGNNGNISEPVSDLGKNLPTRARRIVSKGDVIISSIEGSLSSCALITQEFDKHLVSTGFFVLNSKLLNGETLFVIFKSQIFQEYLKKFPSGTILCAINKEELPNILIPKIDSITQEKIANHIQKSFKLRAEAKALLEEAKIKVESTIAYGGGGLIILQIKNKLKETRKEYRLAQWELISSLFNFKDVASKNLNISIRSFKDSFKTTGRLDSEYYQKKYEINNKMIMNKEYNTLDNLVQIAKSVEPGSDLYKSEGIPFMRVANLTQYGLNESDVFLDEKDFLPQDLQALYPKKDTILFSKDGSIGIAYCIKENQEIVTSSAILHLHIKNKEKILPEYLTLFLNSIFTKLQAQRDCGGSIISHWRIEDIKKVLVAIIDIKIQEKISNYIQESFNLRKKSKQLLDNAKNKVEKQIQGKK